MFINSIALRKCTAGLKSNLHNNLESVFVRTCIPMNLELLNAEPDSRKDNGAAA